MLVNALPARSSRFVFMLMILAAGVLVVVSLSWRMVLASPADAVLGQPLVAQAPLLAPQTYTVTTTADGGVGSLRQAILGSESNPPGPNKIVFNIPGAGVHSIAPLTPLPDMLVPVLIDGYTQPGASPNTLAAGNNAVLRIELDGSSGNLKLYGLQLSGGGSTVRGLVINRFISAGILLGSNGGDVVAGNFIGTNISGTLPLSNNVGIDIAGVSANTIGGPAPADRNLLSGNSAYGLYIFATFTFTGGNLVPITPTNNLVQGNYIGTNAAGTAALGNGNGVGIIGGISNTIGAPGAVSTTIASSANPSVAYVPRNLISGNVAHGIGLWQGATFNRVQGNDIGVDVSGNNPLGNGADGVNIVDSSNNMMGGVNGTTLGGPCTGDCNHIAYNGGFAINIVESGVFAINVVQTNVRAINDTILSNSKHGNHDGGIAFNSNSTPVDNPGCANTAGPNEGINSPQVVSGSPPNVNKLVVLVRCKANTHYLVQLFRNNPCGTEDRTLVAAGTTLTRPGDGGSEWQSNLVSAIIAGSNCFTATITEIQSSNQTAASGLAAAAIFGDTSKDSLPFTPSFVFLPLIRR